MRPGRVILLVGALVLPAALLVAGLMGEPRSGAAVVVDTPALVVTDPAPRPSPTPGSGTPAPTPAGPSTGPVAPPAPPAVPLDDDDDDDDDDGDGPDLPDDDD